MSLKVKEVFATLLPTANVDNIDNNPSARIGKDSFHVTAVSLLNTPVPTATASLEIEW